MSVLLGQLMDDAAAFACIEAERASREGLGALPPPVPLFIRTVRARAKRLGIPSTISVNLATAGAIITYWLRVAELERVAR